ncbi:MAG: hypothetical protein JXQ67_01770 [Campylobacterales bacterium]|nr:hypothetical protein [Campylobacterales bacterium]
MYKIIIFTFFTTLLYAKNPNVYAVLGDVIYNNVDSIEKLQNIEAYKDYKLGIKNYVSLVHETKEQGFAIESGDDIESKGKYLSTLRELSKKNDFYIRKAQNSYKNAVENEDSTLFTTLVNSGLIDTEKNKEDILQYYFEHADDINTSGVIQSYLDEDAALKNKQAAQARYKSKKEREAEKIKRIRQNDLEAQKRLEERLQEEVNRKKIEIRENQKKELTK